MQFDGGLYAERGIKPYLLERYIDNRESELWRSTRIMEQLCEYILWLEAKHERSTD